MIIGVFSMTEKDKIKSFGRDVIFSNENIVVTKSKENGYYDRYLLHRNKDKCNVDIDRKKYTKIINSGDIIKCLRTNGNYDIIKKDGSLAIDLEYYYCYDNFEIVGKYDKCMLKVFIGKDTKVMELTKGVYYLLKHNLFEVNEYEDRKVLIIGDDTTIDIYNNGKIKYTVK